MTNVTVNDKMDKGLSIKASDIPAGMFFFADVACGIVVGQHEILLRINGGSIVRVSGPNQGGDICFANFVEARDVVTNYRPIKSIRMDVTE